MTETFPTPWKMAEVTPILKSGDHENANNNQPTSLLRILSKICKKATLNQFLSYFVLFCRLTTNQSGKKILLDMSKAFDSINHGILLNKLQDVGASNAALQSLWFHSYLSNRSQTVRTHPVLSDPLPMVNGVPQGSILGPVLFSIHMQGLPKIPRSFSADCYVDNTKLYIGFSVQNYHAITEINNDLIKARNWCCDNLLLLNLDMSELIILQTSRFSAHFIG